MVIDIPFLDYEGRFQSVIFITLRVPMDTSELETKSSLEPILTYSTSSDASSLMLVRGRLGTRLSFDENISIEDETILSKYTNESSDSVKEKSNILRFLKIEKKAALMTDIRNSIEDLSFNKTFELSSELEGFISFENSDMSILMKSSNSAISRKDIFKHFYKLNDVQALIINNEISNATKSNLTLSLQDLKLDNNNSKKYSTKSINKSSNKTRKSILGIINGSNQSRKHSEILSSFENEQSPDERYINKNKSEYLNKSNHNIKLCEQKNSSLASSVSENRNESILKNKLKHCEVKLIDYLVEQETHHGRHIEKNELKERVNKLSLNSTKEKQNFKNRSVIENNKENIKEFINYFRKCSSLEYKLDKSNLYHYVDDSLHEHDKKLSNKENLTKRDIKEENYQNNIEKTRTKSASNEDSTKKSDKNKKNYNIYSKFGKCNKSKFDVKSMIEKISETKTTSDNEKDKIEDIRSSTSFESDDSSSTENDVIEDISDRVSSRLRNIHRSKPKCTNLNSLIKQITEENIKKVVHKITSTPMSSKNNLTEKKSKTNIINSDIRYRLRKYPQNIKCNNQTKMYVRIIDIRKFLRSKLPRSSKTNTLLDCEDIIQKVNIAIRNAQSKKMNINIIITILKELLYEKDICKNFIEFYTFISNFTPFYFQKKVMPLGGAFGCDGPKVTNKLSDMLG